MATTVRSVQCVSVGVWECAKCGNRKEEEEKENKKVCASKSEKIRVCFICIRKKGSVDRS